MLSRPKSKYLKSIGFKVAAWYTVIFMGSALLLFLIAYIFMAGTLKKQDHEEIVLELSEISSLYEIGGIRALETFVTESQNSGRSNPLFIRIADRTHRTIHVFAPEQWEDFDLSALEDVSLSWEQGARWQPWVQLPAEGGGHVLDIIADRLTSGHWVQVGMSSEGRERILRHFHKIMLMVILPLFLLGLGGGVFLSRKTLSPIRDIIQAVRSIKFGQKAAGVPRTMAGDELDELAVLFNAMLGNINTLITGMRHSLDNVAHDLRTPMTRFRNVAEIALGSGDNETLRESLAKGVEESDRILKMLNTLMDISEAENGVMEIDRKPSDISRVVGKISEMYEFVAEEKGITFAVDVETPLSACVDINRISQVIANLLDNAVKFTPEGGHVEVRGVRVENAVSLTITDTGTGIAPEDLPRIWDRLFRGDRSRSEKGLGLGLSLVKGIVEAHGGTIDVHSSPGDGCSFVLLFPDCEGQPKK